MVTAPPLNTNWSEAGEELNIHKSSNICLKLAPPEKQPAIR